MKNLFGEVVEKHPSYVLLSFSRINGNPGPFFGSALDAHEHYIELRIAKAEQRVAEHGDVHYYGSLRGDVAEVRMTAAQFAELITTMNAGSGVPATLTSVGGVRVEKPPSHSAGRNVREARAVFGRRMQQAKAAIDELSKGLAERLSKKVLTKEDRQSILGSVEAVAREIGANAEYWLQLFEEATEKVVQSAKADIDGFITSAAHRAGIEAMAKLSSASERAIPAPREELSDVTSSIALIAGSPCDDHGMPGCSCGEAAEGFEGDG